MTQKSPHSEITRKQIKSLEMQGCTAEDWSRVEVIQPLDVSRLRDCHFSGRIQIGVLDSEVVLNGGIVRQTGIYNATIANCTLGNNVYVHNIENYIANYDIADNVVIKHVSVLAVERDCAFGNGVEVAVINETGGREIPIYDRLSAHTAYILAMYRDRGEVIARLKEIIQRYVASVTSGRGQIAASARIVNCGTIRNVKIGPHAVLEGVSLLDNGSINSSADDPCFVGTNVIARDFILCSGARVSDNAILHHCFVGQGTELAKHYSAENSVFFANCGGFHGEACSVFAGPYTVTFHKSTLLIAGFYSFLNAGSGSNQSNHMYKLGPMHQGVVERGSKTASDSYILWPARVGAFSLVMGRHYGNSDTADLPFSYLIEYKDESVLVPGVNLRNIGTVRDSRKWPQRDRRRDPVKLDKIVFSLLSPWTVQKMMRGRQILCDLKESSGLTSQNFYYNGVRIKRSSLEHGIHFYQLGIDRYLGNVLVGRLRRHPVESCEQLRALLKPVCKEGRGQWVDLAGLITPYEGVETLLADVESGAVASLEQVDERINAMYERFEDHQWTWVVEALAAKVQKPVTQFEPADVACIIADWIAAVEALDRMRLSDAQKEYGPASRISFGIDGGDAERDADFHAIRGTPEDNGFICEMKERLESKKRTAADLITRLESLG
ncbi:MAG: DUF4954 family protein [Phycisphaerae bacterium]|nr:DUF4954 family protein [Phycisphaerae bacterium]